MSLFGALYTGVSGLGAQSQATAMISNNIANVNTTGFKRSEANFYSLVTTESRASIYSPGTVSVDRVQRVNQQGPIQQTSSSTDAAVSGDGMFTVKRAADDAQEFLYTRSGSFSEDSQGLLRNTAGFVLYAWPIDSNGDLPANQGDLTSLVPADVAFLGGLTRPTSSAEMSINLDAENTGDPDKGLSAALTATADYSRGLTVYDSLGQGQAMTFEFTKVYGPQATAAGTIQDLTATDNLINDLGLGAGDQLTITDDAANSLTLTVVAGTPAAAGEVQNINDILTEINTSGFNMEAYIGNAGEMIIQQTDFQTGTETLTITNTTGTPFTSLGITTGVYTSDDLTGVDGVSGDSIYDNGDPTDSPPYSNSGGTDINSFPTFQYIPGDTQYNSRGWWQMKVIHPNGSTLSNGLINFNGDGSLNALPDSQGNIDIELNQIDWGNGSDPQNINVDIERFSQFSGNFDTIFSDQNGAELGLRTGVEITRDGYVVAQFSNGATADLYKLPLVTFANTNGLQEVSGTAYSKTDESGENNLREAGTGGAGYLEPSTVEASNVDLADEFAKLIVAQRAYSANTKVINTVDQMTEDLLRLR